MGLVVDRHLGGHIYDPANGGVLLWQHLFWFFGHPEVYIIALPFFGIVSEIFPVFSRKPIFGYTTLVYATLGIAALSIAVWAHHMYASGAVLLPFFSFMTFLIAVPTGVKFFNWIGTMWKGQLTFESPMLCSIGFIVTFLFGGLSGVILASPPLDFHVTDSYFVVAHFHYVLFGTIVFATFAGIYFWFPKMTGRMMDERLGKWHFWTTFFGFHGTFLVQHWLGAEGMPRRYADYLPSDGFTVLNSISTIGAFVLGASTLPFVWNVFKSYRYGEVVTVDDPWGYGNSLEWATTCPPPRHNFTSCRGSAPSVRRSSCTTRTWSSGCAPRRTSARATRVPANHSRNRGTRCSPWATRATRAPTPSPDRPPVRPRPIRTGPHVCSGARRCENGPGDDGNGPARMGARQWSGRETTAARPNRGDERERIRGDRAGDSHRPRPARRHLGAARATLAGTT